MESIPTPPPEVQQQLLVELRTNWQFAAISQFFHLFHSALQMKEWDTDQFEEQLVKGNKIEVAHLCCRLLIKLTGNTKISIDNLTRYLRAEYVKHAPHKNPWPDSEPPQHLSDLSLSTQLAILKDLTDWQWRDPKQFRSRLKNPDDVSSWRSEPVGQDAKGNKYWVFKDNRLYRELPQPSKRSTKATANGKAGRGKKNDKKSKPKVEEEAQATTESTGWETVCVTLQEWREFPRQWVKSRGKAEKELYRTLNEEILPEVLDYLEAKEKEKRRQEALANSRRSTRLAVKAIAKAEEARLAEVERMRITENRSNENRSNENRSNENRIRRSQTLILSLDHHLIFQILDVKTDGFSDYLEERDPSLWSYIDFLTLNRTLIVQALPHLDNQKGLDGAWTKRFLLAVEEMSSESADDIRRKKVIIERLQSETQSIYDKETLQTFGAAGKFYGKRLRLPYKEDATSSGDKRDSTLDSDLIPPARAKKLKPDEENVNVEGVDSGNIPENPLQLTSLAYQQFTDKYQKIPQESKWTLSTGKVVKDALYAFGMKCSHEHLCHSFLIDPYDENYIQQGIFTFEELKEIKIFDKKKSPLIPADLLKYLNGFRKDHLEAWIMLHIWTFIDKAFLDIDGMEITRGESCSYASSNRKNSQRTVPSTSPLKRKAMGRRGDLIIRKGHLEYGCSEAGKNFDGKNGTKIIKEGGLKMPKMLRDMLNDLCEAVEMQECKIRKLETIGFIIAGLRISLIRVDLPAGHVYRLSRTRLFEIPTQVSEFGAKVLLIISLVWKAKEIVKNVIKLMEEEDLSAQNTTEL
ncbi:11713_t:CDS:10 [Paraglomus brasilianum]|uniref:11713_t:CDS:1 n=1 Tax=Paraglomus brasilianum TaxID=144538 RepID=A0A9N9F0H9_9GLOM|nr:11713_t:CDS:10 [Paraglomus brasilianum]